MTIKSIRVEGIYASLAVLIRMRMNDHQHKINQEFVDLFRHAHSLDIPLVCVKIIVKYSTPLEGFHVMLQIQQHMEDALINKFPRVSAKACTPICFC